MTNSNKILTVSYGTFSCTLEGFDDSLETMKAVAEYFRDLAAKDRFFGSEPVQVDAAALTKIAKEAGAQDVEVDAESDHIKLRTIDAENASPERSELATGATDTAAAAAVAAAGVAAAKALNDTEDSPVDGAELQDDAPDDGTDTPATAKAALTDDDVSEEDGAITDSEEHDVSVADAELETAAEPSVSDQDDESDGNSESVAADDDITAESVADKLQRIRAAEEQNAALDENAQPEHDTKSDAEAQKVEADDVVTEARNNIEDALEEDDNLVADESAPDSEVDELSKLLSRLDEAADAEAKNDAALEAEENKAGFVGEDEFELVENLFDDEKSNAAGAAAAAKKSVALSEEKSDANKAEKEKPLSLSGYQAAEASSETQQGQPKEVTGETEATKLTEKGKDVLVLGAADVRAAPTSDRAKTRQLSRELLPSLDETEGSDVNRLLAKADTQMGEPENATRRRAFSHLRAAVAAKKADSSIGRNGEKAGRAYRSDLADASPVPPKSRDVNAQDVADDAPAAKPAAATAHVSPLKLVAEPGDDSAAKVSAPTDTIGFEEFAKEFGASSLSQRLEAAAAYISFIECAENFSRTQLMKVATQGSPQEFSREDGLRSFGTLLREGRLQKLPGGLFSVSEDTEYRPKKRAAS